MIKKSDTPFDLKSNPHDSLTYHLYPKVIMKAAIAFSFSLGIIIP